MESFLRDDVDLTYVTKVAVFPFENNSKELFAAERIRGMAITQILADGLFDVVDKSLVDSALREEAIDITKAPVDAATMKRLGQRLTVQAFLLGSIDQAGVVQRGNNSYPELSITLRLVDSNTGMIIWQASGNRSGDSMGKRLFGFSSDDDFKIAIKLLRKIIATIASDRKVKLPTNVAASQSKTSDDSIQQIEPQEDIPSEGQDASANEIAPEDSGEAGGLNNAPLEQVDPQGQDFVNGQDESLHQDKQTPSQEAPVEQDRPSEPPTSPSQDKISEPSALAEPVVVPPAQEVEQAWPE